MHKQRLSLYVKDNQKGNNNPPQNQALMKI